MALSIASERERGTLMAVGGWGMVVEDTRRVRVV